MAKPGCTGCNMKMFYKYGFAVKKFVQTIKCSSALSYYDLVTAWNSSSQALVTSSQWVLKQMPRSNSDKALQYQGRKMVIKVTTLPAKHSFEFSTQPYKQHYVARMLLGLQLVALTKIMFVSQEAESVAAYLKWLVAAGRLCLLHKIPIVTPTRSVLTHLISQELHSDHLLELQNEVPPKLRPMVEAILRYQIHENHWLNRCKLQDPTENGHRLTTMTALLDEIYRFNAVLLTADLFNNAKELPTKALHPPRTNGTKTRRKHGSKRGSFSNNGGAPRSRKMSSEQRGGGSEGPGGGGLGEKYRKITFGEIRNKFLVTFKYGEGVNWPKSTVMACRIRGPEGNLLLEKAYRNSKQHHAEINFLHDPESVQIYENTTDIFIEVFINYSPCSECAETIGQFVKKNEVKKINIMFANLYKIPPYPDVVIAKKNENGLYLLSKVPGIQLSVFSTIEDWKRFLGGTFVNARNAKKNMLLKKATGEDRRNREMMDVQILEKIKSGDPL